MTSRPRDNTSSDAGDLHMNSAQLMMLWVELLISCETIARNSSIFQSAFPSSFFFVGSSLKHIIIHLLSNYKWGLPTFEEAYRGTISFVYSECPSYFLIS